MRDKYLKARIRLNKLAARQRETNYKALNIEQKKYVKLEEAINLNSREIDRFWRKNLQNEVRDENNLLILASEEWEYLNILFKNSTSLNKRQTRVVIKNNWSDDDIGLFMSSHKQSNCHSVSY